MTDQRIGTVLDERYRILDELGSGGMGVVYRGERVKLGRNVAIKFLHAWMAADASFLKRFEIEARAMAKLQHPHCASVIDFGVDGKAPYVVMDLVAGEPLRALLDRERLSVARAIEIVRQVLSGLAHAHTQGITHRDIKPDNIMVDASGAFGDQVRILDFGLAKLREGATGLTTGFVVGTPDYMAPEQSLAESVDERTDVYSAGVVLFEMLAGRPPFQAESIGEVLQMHREVPPPRLAEVAAGTTFSSELEDVVARALAKEPAQRFPSAAAFATALDAVPEAARGAARASTGDLETGRPETGASDHSDTRRESADDPSAETKRKRLESAATAFLDSAPEAADADPGATASLRPQSEPAPAAPAPPAGPMGPAGPAPASAAMGGVATPGVGTPGVTTNLAPPLPAPMPPDQSQARRPRWLGPVIAVAVLGVVVAIGLSGSGDPAPATVAPGAPAPAPSAAAPGPAPSVQTGADEPADPANAADQAQDQASDQAAAEAEVAPEGGADLPELARARALVEAGRAKQARRLLEKLRPRHPDLAEIHYLLGRAYFDMLWCRDGIDSYRAAIARHPPYRMDPTLIESAVGGLANDKYHGRVARFIAREIGAPAIPHLEDMAANYRREAVRDRAARLLNRLR